MNSKVVVYLSTVPPSEVRVSAPKSARIGESIALSCVAENSYPAADISLVINGQTPPGTSSSLITRDDGGFDTMANLTAFEIRPMDTDLVVACYAHNHPLGDTKVDTQIVTVLSKLRLIIYLKASNCLRLDNKLS